MEKQANILYVEHEKDFAQQTEELLKINGFGVCAIDSYRDIDKICRRNLFHLLLAEFETTDEKGLEQIHFIKRQNKQLPLVIYSKCCEPEIITQAMDFGVEDYITKDCNTSLFIAKLKNIIRRHYKHPHQLYFSKISEYTSFDYVAEILTIHEEKIKLKPMDARLLKLLCARLNEYSDGDYLCLGMWNLTGKEKDLKRYILRIRRLLTPDTSIQIENNRGGSYRLKTLC